MFVIYIGGPFDGGELLGPFEKFQDAIDFVDTRRVEEFEIVEVKSPYEEGKVMPKSDISISIRFDLMGIYGPCNEICITCEKHSFYYDFPVEEFSLSKCLADAAQMFEKDSNETATN